MSSFPPRHCGIRIFLRGSIVDGAETLDVERVAIDVIDYDVDYQDADEPERDNQGRLCWIYTA